MLNLTLKGKKLINKCLFPAAGYGTRFLPATKAVPKEMLPIINKPLLQYGVEEAIDAGISNMSIVTGRGKRAIEDHFDNSFELESQLNGTSKEHFLDDIKKLIMKSSFTYVRQHEMLGLGHAILCGQPLIGNEAFAVILADDLCFSPSNGVINQLIDVYRKYKCSVIAVEEVSSEQIVNYGAVIGKALNKKNDIYRVTNMMEKPNLEDLTEFQINNKIDEKKNFMGIVGRYILTPDIFNILKNIKTSKDNELQITDALLIQAKQGKVIACKFEGTRFDCGHFKGYLEATNYYAKKMGVV